VAVLMQSDHMPEKFQNYTVDTNKEILFFVPGFNSNLDLTTHTFGQFLSLGGFSDDVLPWIFIWPMGTVLTYFQVLEIASSDLLMSHLEQSINDIVSLGYSKIHVITHSMGARVFLNYLKRTSSVQSISRLIMTIIVTLTQTLTQTQTQTKLEVDYRARGADPS